MVREVTAALLLSSLLASPIARAQVASPPQIIGRLGGTERAQGATRPGVLGHGSRLDRRAQGRAADPVRRHRRHVRFRLLRADPQRRLAGRDPAPAARDGRSAADLPDRPERSERAAAPLRLPQRRVPADGLRAGARRRVQRRAEPRRHHGTRRNDPVQRGSRVAGRRVSRPARGSPRQDELEERRRPALLADAGRVHSRTERHLHPVRARDRRRVQPGAARICTPTPTGLCVDPSSSQNDGTPASEIYTTGNEMEFAIQDPDHRGNYESVATLRTNKFINPTARTVKRFTGASSGSDYGPGDGTVLVWGRPGFRGEEGRQAQTLPARAPAADQARDQRALALPAPVLRRGARARTSPSGRASSARRSRWRSTASPAEARSRSSRS